MYEELKKEVKDLKTPFLLNTKYKVLAFRSTDDLTETAKIAQEKLEKVNFVATLKFRHDWWIVLSFEEGVTWSKLVSLWTYRDPVNFINDKFFKSNNTKVVTVLKELISGVTHL